jgi:hypothetical protein
MTGIHKVFKEYGYPTKDKESNVEFWKPQNFTRDPTILHNLRRKNTLTYVPKKLGKILEI